MTLTWWFLTQCNLVQKHNITMKMIMPRQKATDGTKVITSLEYVGERFFSSLLDDGIMLVYDS